MIWHRLGIGCRAVLIQCPCIRHEAGVPGIVISLALHKYAVTPEVIKEHNAVVGLIIAEHNVAVSLDRFKVVQGIMLDLLKAPMAERDPFFHHAGTGVEVA